MTRPCQLNVRGMFFCIVVLLLGLRVTPLVGQMVDFDDQVAPLLVSHCLECHRGTQPEGGLNLADPKLASEGGDSGAAWIAGNAADSLLWERIDSDEMPPKHPLDSSQKDVLKRWIDEGARWGSESLDLFSITTDTRAGRDFWSLQPIGDVTVPSPKTNWGRNAIDAFVLHRLEQTNLQPSPDADPRSLIRRLYFDLIGLPPTPQQVSAFVADPSEAAYQKVVDDLLSSQHYGERWGRHWLDVVRFGESDGYERNFQRDNAWHYRDWVIDAFNHDMPYDAFVRMQLIGDQLSNGIEGAAATGFWVAGVHNTTVGGSKRMQQLARQDEIEEVLGTLGQAFVGLTFNCARCHDHKFDPITQTEYYQLSSAISGLGFGERNVPLPIEQAKLVDLNAQLSRQQAELASLDKAARDRVISARKENPAATPEPPAAISRWEFDSDLNDSVGRLHGKAHGTARLENGALVLDGQSFVETTPIPNDVAEKTLEAWVQLDDLNQRGGAAITLGALDGGAFDAIVFGEREPKRWMPGSDGFARTDSFGGVEEADALDRPVHVAIVYQSDGTIIGYRDGLAYGHSVRKAGLRSFASESAQVLFGLRHKPPGGNRFLKARIHRAAFYDRALSPDEIAASAGNAAEFVSEAQLVASMDDQELECRSLLRESLSELVKARDEQAARSTQKVYTLAAGRGETTNVLLRGDPDSIGDVVPPGATSALASLSADFALPPDAAEGERRRKLSAWITDDANPLFARVIVNRLWHHHFGAGIVDTPNDFGFNGGRPSHPQLLDFLAAQLKAHGYRLKWLHRMIVSSSAYRQSTYGLAADQWQHANTVDASNRLLWRGSPRRLDAESLRDAMLFASGQLNVDPGGPSFKDVSVAYTAGTTYYEPVDVDGPEFFRRTVYRFNPRGGRSSLLDTFDCPDPAFTAPKRSFTTTPLQSLSLLNNALVLRMSEYFAARIQSEVGDDIAAQVDRAWQVSVARDPTEGERKLSAQLVTQHGLPALCRGLFNFHEFVWIE